MNYYRIFTREFTEEETPVTEIGGVDLTKGTVFVETSLELSEGELFNLGLFVKQFPVLPEFDINGNKIVAQKLNSATVK